MSKTNTEKMAPETQTPEMANGMKLDVRVRPIAPMGNLLAFANVTIGGCFKIDGFRICSSEKGLYVNMPATQDKGGNWKDVCWPVTAEFRKQLNDALIDGYGQAIENLQATLEATKGAAEKPSLTGALKENAGKVKEQPTKPAPSKNEQDIRVCKTEIIGGTIDSKLHRRVFPLLRLQGLIAVCRIFRMIFHKTTRSIFCQHGKCLPLRGKFFHITARLWRIFCPSLIDQFKHHHH